MSIRRSKLPLALTLALVASQAQALGLGQMQVKSGLGQPLVAEIPILSATPDELENLDVRLAPPEAFARVGLELPLSLSANLQMSVVRDARGLPVIRVSTPGRFNEPFLSFLVEANWGRGSLVREFTALVDPPYIAPAVIRPLQAPTVALAPAPPPAARPISAAPAVNPATIVQPPAPAAMPPAAPAPASVAAPPPPPMPASPPPAPVAVAPEPSAEFEPSPFSQPLPEIEPEPVPAPAPKPAPVQQAAPPAPAAAPAPQPVAAAPKPAPGPAPQPASPTPPRPEPPKPEPPKPEPPKDQYGPVQDGQTLWSIAQGLKTDDAITVNQMMLALQRANPGAFIKDNVNLLKSGAVLRIPAREEAVAVLPDEAAALIRQQSRMRPVPQPEQSVARETRPEAPAAAPKPEVAAAPARPKPQATTKPAAQPAQARQGRLEIVPPAGKTGARSSQSGASASGGGTELRAELSQAKEDLAAREAEVVELKSRVADLEKLQGDSKSLIEMQNSELKALRDRLAEIEREKQAQAASTSPAATPAVATPREPAPTAAAESTASPDSVVAPTPWYQHPASIGGAILLLGLIAWWLSRRGKTARVASLTRRMGEGTAPPASLAAKPMGKVEEPAEPPAPVAEEDFEMLGLQDMVNMNPRDLEAHLNLLRYLHRKGDAAAFEAAATDMRGQIGNTTDPRWREVVVMGMGLLPGHPLFSQLGWNAPKFASHEPAEKPAAPKPAVAEAEGQPSWMRTTGPSQIPGKEAAPVVAEAQPAAPAEPEAPPGEIDLEPLDGGASDIHRQEAELQATDEASSTKIELAKAYLDIGDIDGARAMLEDVLAEGSPAAREMAAGILKELG